MKKWMIFLLVISLISLIILPACGNDEEEATPTMTVTSTSTKTATLTPTPAKGPVKIGFITDWSGPSAMAGMLADEAIKLVEWQVKQMGGILGGRELDVVTYDSRGSVADSVAGAQKLFLDKEIGVIMGGTGSTAAATAMSQFAEDNKILYISWGGQVPDLEKKQFSLNGTTASDYWATTVISCIKNVMKPQTIAYLAMDAEDSHQRVGWYKNGYTASTGQFVAGVGAKVVYEQYFVMGTIDFSPYLTKIKYANPDVLVIDTPVSEDSANIAKEIMDLGGWGNIKVYALSAAAAVVGMPGGEGWYMDAMWVPGLPYPGSVKFEQDFQTVLGHNPAAYYVYHYFLLWDAVTAIQTAGTDTDRVAIAQASRSGKMTWESPVGSITYLPTGWSNARPVIFRVQGDKEIYVEVPPLL